MTELLAHIMGNIENLMPRFSTMEDACEYVYGHKNVPVETLMQIQMQQDCVVKYAKELAAKLLKTR